MVAWQRTAKALSQHTAKGQAVRVREERGKTRTRSRTMEWQLAGDNKRN
jgi:hypothetical protein